MSARVPVQYTLRDAVLVNPRRGRRVRRVSSHGRGKTVRQNRTAGSRLRSDQRGKHALFVESQKPPTRTHGKLNTIIRGNACVSQRAPHVNGTCAYTCWIQNAPPESAPGVILEKKWQLGVSITRLFKNTDVRFFFYGNRDKTRVIQVYVYTCI